MIRYDFCLLSMVSAAAAEQHTVIQQTYDDTVLQADLFVCITVA